MKEWYLNKYSPDVTSRFENDAISEYAESNFTDVLETTFSDEVILYNHDLTQHKNIKCVIQGNSADIRSNSTDRLILAAIGTLHSGDYIYFDNSYWLIDGRPGNNKSYEKATMVLCQYKLKWQTRHGRIIERWCNLSSASKYGTGEKGNKIILSSTNNYTVLIPFDDDGQTIEGKRVFIDTTKYPQRTFKITRNDDPLYFYGTYGGVLNLIADRTEFNTETDRPDLKLCDYIPALDSEENDGIDESSSVKITGKPYLTLGFSREYSLKVVDGADIDTGNCEWKISDNPGIDISVKDGAAVLFTDNEDLIGISFYLSVFSDGKELSRLKITISEGW